MFLFGLCAKCLQLPRRKAIYAHLDFVLQNIPLFSSCIWPELSHACRLRIPTAKLRLEKLPEAPDPGAARGCAGTGPAARRPPLSPHGPQHSPARQRGTARPAGHSGLREAPVLSAPGRFITAHIAPRPGPHPRPRGSAGERLAPHPSGYSRPGWMGL